MIDTTANVLPQFVDLRPSVNQIEDQGPIGSCVANAAASMLEIEWERLCDKYPGMHDPIDLSRMYLYYWMRNFGVRSGQEGGAPEDMMKALTIKGVCLESTWPYKLPNTDVQPPSYCDVEAKKWLVLEYASLTATNQIGMWAMAAEKFRSNIKHALAQGRPVIISMWITQAFQLSGSCKEWKLTTWDERSSSGNPTLGSHAVVLIGYDDVSQRFLAQNSWGPGWGDGGFFGIPYARFADAVTSAYCSVNDVIGFTSVKDYLPKVFDPERAKIITAYFKGHQMAIRNDLKYFSVPPDEVDTAMQWPAGTASTVFDV